MAKSDMEYISTPPYVSRATFTMNMKILVPTCVSERSKIETSYFGTYIDRIKHRTMHDN